MEPDYCPFCATDLQGEEVPEKYRDEYYGGRHTKLVI
jgi:hypothetical protein